MRSAFKTSASIFSRDETPETKCALVMKEEAAQLSLAAGFVYVTPSAAVPGFVRKQKSPDINISVEKN